MSGQARELPLERVTPGMRLSAPILDGRGETLLAEGVVLSESHLASLRRRAVRSVLVVTPEEELDADDHAMREVARARLAHLFRHCGDSDADRALLEAVSEFRQEPKA